MLPLLCICNAPFLDLDWWLHYKKCTYLISILLTYSTGNLKDSRLCHCTYCLRMYWHPFAKRDYPSQGVPLLICSDTWSVSFVLLTSLLFETYDWCTESVFWFFCLCKAYSAISMWFSYQTVGWAALPVKLSSYELGWSTLFSTSSNRSHFFVNHLTKLVDLL